MRQRVTSTKRLLTKRGHASDGARPRLDPKLAEVYYGRGSAYVGKGDYDKAISDYTEAIRLNPRYAEAYCSRGSAYGRKGDFDKAIADDNEAIHLNPKDAVAYCNRGD